jgi:hypothetical protein
MQIDLVQNLPDLIHRHIVLDERHRDEERHQPLVRVPEEFIEFCTLPTPTRIGGATDA